METIDTKAYKTSKEEMKHDEAILSWDTSNFVDMEVKNRKEYDTGQTEEELIDEINSDSDFWSFVYADLTEELTNLMLERNPNCKWTARVENFGWRKTSGSLEEFHCEDGSSLINKILPKTECTYYIFNYEENGKKGFAINNAHHDSPDFSEWYFVLSA